MNEKRFPANPPLDNTEKDPDDWVTGNEPMTGAQRSYLKTLSEAAHEPFDESLTKAEASRRIDELQTRTGVAGARKPGTADERQEPEGALESLGEAVSDTVLGSEPDGNGGTRRTGG
ncbi:MULTISPECIES: DUF3072 domain-containing protein [unclassified Roseateles]|uniref:DUF3072 domain-containing protein n=1 Tax=unclassified Roseateles TaxID=2626991 RepID=UPI0009E89CE7|nr:MULTISPECIES: DUF3072 domain-containing protein [unclassified Roseateles]